MLSDFPAYNAIGKHSPTSFLLRGLIVIAVCMQITILDTQASFAQSRNGPDLIQKLVDSDDFQKLPFNERLIALDQRMAEFPDDVNEVVWARGVSQRLALMATLGEFEKGDAYLAVVGERLNSIIPDTDFYAETLYPIGYINVYNNKVEQALAIVEKIKRHASDSGAATHRQNADTLMVALHTNIGNAVQAAEIMIGNFEKPSVSELKTIERLKLLMNISYVLIQGDQLDRAEKYIALARKESEIAQRGGEMTEIEATQVAWHLLSNYALILIKKEQYASLSDLVPMLVKDAQKIGSPLYQASADHVYAASLFGQGDVQSAIEITTRAIETAMSLGVDDSLMDYYNSLSIFKEAAGDYQGALEAVQARRELVDSLNAQQSRARTEFMEARITLEENNTRIQKLIADKDAAEHLEKRNRIILALLMLVVVTLGMLVSGLSRSKKRLTVYAEELRESEKKAHAATQAKSSFLANMSHEIRTPLNGLLGMAQILSEEELEPYSKKCVGVVVDCGQSLLTIVNDVLDLSKIEAGKMTIENVPTDIQRLFHQLIQLYRTQAEEKGIDLSLELSPSIDRILACDPVRLRQCASNLITNAIKFTNTGGVLVKVGLSSDEKGQESLVINVIDTGIGIPMDAREKLFNAFEQIDKSTTRKFGGTGLGLAITSELANLMGGNVTLDSMPGHGSTFTLRINVQSVADRSIDALTHHELSADHLVTCARGVTQGHLRLLLVDDNNVNRLVAKAFLQDTDIEVVEAVDGCDAVRALQESGPFDVVLLDMHMPVMDGPETVKYVRNSDEVWRDIPIITLTADAMAGDRARYLDMGTDGYVAKPLDKGELLREINRVVSALKIANSAAA